MTLTFIKNNIIVAESSNSIVPQLNSTVTIPKKYSNVDEHGRLVETTENNQYRVKDLDYFWNNGSFDQVLIYIK